MRKKMIFILSMVIPLFILGCGNEEVTNDQPYSGSHITFLRSANPNLSEEEANEYPVYYTIDIEREEISVLSSIGEDFEDYELQYFSNNDDTVEFTYNNQSVTLERATDNTFVDESGNTYQIDEK